MEKNFQKGLTLLEIMVVMSIMAVLMVMAGLATYNLQRDRLLLEQAGRELVAEIRLAQSKMLSIQEVTAEGRTFIPKAAGIALRAGNNPQIYYLQMNPAFPNDCTRAVARLGKTFNFNNRGSIFSMNLSSPVYLIYTSPAGKFYITQSGAFISGANNSCVPQTPNNTNLDVNLQKGSNNFHININAKTGEITTSN